MTTPAIPKDDAYCRLDGCFNLRKDSSICSAHDHHRRQGKDYRVAKGQHMEPWDYPICEFDDCSRPAAFSGLCSSHAAQKKRGEPVRALRAWAEQFVCSWDGCPTRAAVGELCRSHHMMRLGLSPESTRTRLPCAISWCEGSFSQHGKSGLCKNHKLMARKYGLTAHEALVMYEDYRCAICGTSEGNLHVDHDHSCCPGGNDNKCGKCVRGLLCMHCNHMIGNAKEDPALLLAAIDYLARGIR